MDTVYHYCSADAFLNIIKYKKLWLGDPLHMNDFMERQWFVDVFNEVVSELNEVVSTRLYEETQDKIFDIPKYICCLSEDGDILSQWRTYAQDGMGVSIGFEPRKLTGNCDNKINHNIYISKSFYLNKIEYLSQNDIKTRIKAILNMSEGAKKYFTTRLAQFYSLDEPVQNEIEQIFISILHMQIHTKNPAFAEEKEYRLLYNNMSDHFNPGITENHDYDAFIKSKKYRISNQNLTSYYEFPIPEGSITKIILGPKNKFSENDVKEFLKLNGISNDVIVKRSTASYR